MRHLPELLAIGALAFTLQACNDNKTSPPPPPIAGIELKDIQRNGEVVLGSTKYKMAPELASSPVFLSLLASSHDVLNTIWGSEPLNARGEDGLTISFNIDPRLPDGMLGSTEDTDSNDKNTSITLKSWNDQDPESIIVFVEELSHAFGLPKSHRGLLGMIAEAGGEDTLNDEVTIRALNELGLDGRAHFQLPSSRFDTSALPAGIFANPNQFTGSANRGTIIRDARSQWNSLLSIFPSFPSHLKMLGQSMSRTQPEKALFPWDAISQAAVLAQSQGQALDIAQLNNWVSHAQESMWNLNPGIYITTVPGILGGDDVLCTTAIASFPDGNRWRYENLSDLGMSAQVNELITSRAGKMGTQQLSIVPGQTIHCASEDLADPLSAITIQDVRLFPIEGMQPHPMLGQLPTFIGSTIIRN